MTENLQSGRLDRYWTHISFLFLTAAFAATLLARIFQIGVEDWPIAMIYTGYPIRSVIDFGQFPLWNPYYCGGTPYFANYQSFLLTPFFLLHLIFGGIVGLKLTIIGHFAVGLYGLYFLARYFGLERRDAIYAAALYMLSDWYAAQMAVGHPTFITAVYLPWGLFFFLKSLSDLRYAIAAAAVATLMFFEGGVYIFTYQFLLIGAFAAFFVWRTGLKKTLAAGGLFAFFTLMFCGIKLLPALELNRDFPRIINDISGFNLIGFVEGLLVLGIKLVQDGSAWDGVRYSWWENHFYIGFIGAVLFIAGFAECGKRRWFLSASFVLFALLSLGNIASDNFSVWALLHKVPVFDSLRVAQRFGMVFIIFLAIIAGLGSQRLYRRMGGGALFFLIIGASLFALWFQNYKIFRDNLKVVPPMRHGDGVFQQQIENGYIRFMEGDGDVLCRGEPLRVAKSAIPVGHAAYKGEVYLMNINGAARTIEWSPNKLVYAYDIPTGGGDEGYLVVNQNYNRGWKSADGKAVEKLNGLLAIRVAPGQGKVELYYRPDSFRTGTLLSVVGGFLACVFLVLLSWLRRRSLSLHGGQGLSAP